ncbi:hypothetical protein BDV06DRAFT_35832 [Aspergillus oleicola]
MQHKEVDHAIHDVVNAGAYSRMGNSSFLLYSYSVIIFDNNYQSCEHALQCPTISSSLNLQTESNDMPADVSQESTAVGPAWDPPSMDLSWRHHQVKLSPLKAKPDYPIPVRTQVPRQIRDNYGCTNVTSLVLSTRLLPCTFSSRVTLQTPKVSSTQQVLLISPVWLANDRPLVTMWQGNW